MLTSDFGEGLKLAYAIIISNFFKKRRESMTQNYQTWENIERCPDCNEPIYWSEDKLKYRSNCTCEEFLDWDEEIKVEV